jgi:hypothetical protein
MADAILDIKIDNLEKDCAETQGIVRGLEAECGDLSDRTHRLEFWRDGNGAKGAEARLQGVEVNIVKLSACVEKVASDDTIARIAQVAVKEVIGNAKGRDRTAISKVKAFAPYFAAGCALVAALVATVAK